MYDPSYAADHKVRGESFQGGFGELCLCGQGRRDLLRQTADAGLSKTSAAQETIAANKKMILESGCRTLVLSCPICYKIFKEEYGLKDIEVLHYTQYIKRLVDEGRLKLNAGRGQHCLS